MKDTGASSPNTERKGWHFCLESSTKPVCDVTAVLVCENASVCVCVTERVREGRGIMERHEECQREIFIGWVQNPSHPSVCPVALLTSQNTIQLLPPVLSTGCERTYQRHNVLFCGVSGENERRAQGHGDSMDQEDYVWERVRSASVQPYTDEGCKAKDTPESAQEGDGESSEWDVSV